ncbi:class I SAM-dependent methyltransferase [Aestuariispira insulae]|uniref:2-polyprenyl-3-methyl-5-hydroxy-6-metoxy-1, 4-benzoquinol methylase n=1 Tax=Aestuariispira insulae TaxID=1461337 RepID=A0A3D9HHW0_9PROT|nr:class I SAM-dependent methyltransferase [Aestuariispira insulae]RED49122.1 2-polyprenyl-3-methyl-5-hydroxy-6-metoxy-1,4-benzoquinol methylase [Aestuariispira insulae]
MAAKKTARNGGKVRAQYEDFPYPHRDPRDEKKRLVTGSPSRLPELVHYLFKGHLALNRPFRVLVAGGGTGDALIMLAQQLADAGVEADIHYLDLSSASRAIAEKRAAIRKLNNITFHSGSLLEASDLGAFDYIDCCGVLHHLEQPGTGFRALKGALAPDGGMGIMVYGELGRTGVYHVQEMLRMIAPDGPEDERVSVAKSLIAELPATNWLNKNPQIHDHRESDAGLYDLFLHSQDRAYTVPQLADVVAAAGLEIVSFIDPSRYDPKLMVKKTELRARMAALDPLKQAAFAELLSGNLRKHVCYLTHSGRGREITATVGDPKAVPVFKDRETAAMLHQMPPGAQPNVEADGLSIPLPLPPQAAIVLKAIDGKRSLEEIRKMMPGSPDWIAFATTFAQVFKALNAVGMLFLCRINR